MHGIAINSEDEGGHSFHQCGEWSYLVTVNAGDGGTELADCFCCQ